MEPGKAESGVFRGDGKTSKPDLLKEEKKEQDKEHGAMHLKEEVLCATFRGIKLWQFSGIFETLNDACICTKCAIYSEPPTAERMCTL